MYLRLNNGGACPLLVVSCSLTSLSPGLDLQGQQLVGRCSERPIISWGKTVSSCLDCEVICDNVESLSCPWWSTWHWPCYGMPLRSRALSVHTDGMQMLSTIAARGYRVHRSKNKSSMDRLRSLTWDLGTLLVLEMPSPKCSAWQVS
jgi:hypothetical protein